MAVLDNWYLENLVCPRDHDELAFRDGNLVCPDSHRYPVVDGVPVMLLNDVEQTLDVAEGSLSRASDRSQADLRAPELYLESLGISEAEKAGVVQLAKENGTVDAVVSFLIAATNGLMYKHVIGQLDSYPIPNFPLSDGHGERLLDVGGSWGRWSISASRKGYEVVGIDPSLGAIMAARRVARQLGLPIRYVVGDARWLPFRDGSFDRLFSYSVVQHLSRKDTAQTIGEMGRVLRAGGAAKVQMPARFGIRCLYHQARRAFREAVGFEVRYRSLPALRRLFTQRVGATRFEVDCYFGIGLQKSDAALMTPRLKLVLGASEFLKRASHHLRGLVWLADSVFVESVKAKERVGTANHADYAKPDSLRCETGIARMI